MPEAIDDADQLRRHIKDEYAHADGTISIGAFKTSDMSLDLCRLRTLADSVASHLGWGMAEMLASDIRGVGLTVLHSPVLNEPPYPDNPSHCHIPGKITGSQAKQLLACASLVSTP